MVYTIKFTKHFKKDLKLAKKQHKNLDLLFEIIEMLKNGIKLPDKYQEHVLKGKYNGLHECHVENDWLLIWEIEDTMLILTFYRVNTHSNLFNE